MGYLTVNAAEALPATPIRPASLRHARDMGAAPPALSGAAHPPEHSIGVLGGCACRAGMCPGHNASAGKRKSGKTRKGSQWLRAALTEAAWAASHTRSYLGAQYHRFARRRGKKKAVVAVGHSILVIAYHILKDGTSYHELGQDSFDKRDTARIQERPLARLETLGLRVTVQPMAQAA